MSNVSEQIKQLVQCSIEMSDTEFDEEAIALQNVYRRELNINKAHAIRDIYRILETLRMNT